MSIRYMKWAWETKLSPVPKLILIKLADNANDLGTCYPSISLVSRQCSVSERTVQRAIGEMTAGGFIRVEKRFRNDRSQTSNLYYLLANDAGDNLSHQTVRNEPPLTPLSSEGVRGVTQTTNEPSPIETPLQPCSGGWHFPECLSDAERQRAASLITVLEKEIAQEVLDELAGRMRIVTVRNPLRYLSTLVSKVRDGTFSAELAMAEQDQRKNTQLLNNLNETRIEQTNRDAQMSEVDINLLPERIRSSLLRLKSNFQESQVPTKLEDESDDNT